MQSAATTFGPEVHVVQASPITETPRTSDAVPHWGGALMIGQGRIYDGGASVASQFSKGIAGAGSAQQYNLSVCHSGGQSGTHCGLVVRTWGWLQLSTG